MRSFIFQSSRGFLASAFFALVVLQSAHAQRNQSGASPGGGTAFGFKAGAEYFPPPNQSQVKSLIQGAEARIGVEPVAINQLKITTFHTNGVPEMFITAAECAFYNNTKIASSPATLSVRSADGQFSLEGLGFSWQHSASILTISNNIHSVIRKISSGTGTNLLFEAGQDIEIVSDHFIFDKNTSRAFYRDNVRVVSTNLTLTSGELAVTLPMTNDVIQLNGRSTWTSGSRNGGGDGLEIDRVRNSLRVMGNAYAKMLGTAIGTNAAATDQTFEVLSDDYELTASQAVFHGNVRVTQFAGVKTAGRMTCRTLTVVLTPTEKIQSLLAENNVVVEQEDGRFTGAMASFAATNPVVQFSGNPTWSKGERSGSGTTLLVDQAHNKMTVLGDAKLRLPQAEMKTSATNAVAISTNQMVTITSDNYEAAPGRADFRGHVHVEDTEMNLSSDSLTADSLTGGEQIERIKADWNVVSDLKDSAGKITHVTADHALYTIGDGLLRLTGNPVLQNERGKVSGSIIVWDRVYDLIVVRNEKIKFHQEGAAGTTNMFPNFLPAAKK